MDRGRHQRGEIERNSVIGDGLRINGQEGFGHGLGVAVAVAKQVQIARRPKRIGDPDREEHRTFEDETLAVRRRAQPVEQTLERISRQENLEIRSFGTCPIEESRSPDAPMLSGSRAIGRHCFDVGTYDRPDPRLARVTPELIRLASATAETLAQPLPRDVEANLGPVAKTIDNCLRRIRDGNVDILDAVTLNSFGQNRSNRIAG